MQQLSGTKSVRNSLITAKRSLQGDEDPLLGSLKDSYESFKCINQRFLSYIEGRGIGMSNSNKKIYINQAGYLTKDVKIAVLPVSAEYVCV